MLQKFLFFVVALTTSYSSLSGASEPTPTQSYQNFLGKVCYDWQFGEDGVDRCLAVGNNFLSRFQPQLNEQYEAGLILSVCTSAFRPLPGSGIMNALHWTEKRITCYKRAAKSSQFARIQATLKKSFTTSFYDKKIAFFEAELALIADVQNN